MVISGFFSHGGGFEGWWAGVTKRVVRLFSYFIVERMGSLTE
jgi:hypothetical protein